MGNQHNHKHITHQTRQHTNTSPYHTVSNTTTHHLKGVGCRNQSRLVLRMKYKVQIGFPRLVSWLRPKSQIGFPRLVSCLRPKSQIGFPRLVSWLRPKSQIGFHLCHLCTSSPKSSGWCGKPKLSPTPKHANREFWGGSYYTHTKKLGCGWCSTPQTLATPPMRVGIYLPLKSLPK